MLEELKYQLALLQAVEQLDSITNIANADVGVPYENTPEELERLRNVLEKHQITFLGHGNALPPAVRGVVCDLEVAPGTAPLAQRARHIPGHLFSAVYELLKRLL